jgi:hypothetical protein
MAERTITTSPCDLWVYGTDLPHDDALVAIAEPKVRWDENDELMPWPMAVALGVEHLDHDFVEPAFIDEMTKPVPEFLQAQTRGDAAMFAADKDRLNAVKGAIIMISCDPGDHRLSRTPDAPFYFLGVYPVKSYPVTLGPHGNPSAKALPTQAPRGPNTVKNADRRDPCGYRLSCHGDHGYGAMMVYACAVDMQKVHYEDAI